MSKINAHILLRNRRVKTEKVSHHKSFFIFKKGLYNISSDLIHLDEKDNPELYYFENLPTPLNYGNKNSGFNYLDERVASNLLSQLIPEVKESGWGIGEFIGSLFDDPRKMIFGILALTVLWAIVSSGGF